MTRQRVNPVKVQVFGQEALAVFLESKWTLYGWWVMLGTLAGALGAPAFSPELESPWWELPAYFTLVFAIKRGFMLLARRVFPGDSWWQATNVFLPAFFIACLPAAMVVWTSRTIVALPIVAFAAFVIGFQHSAFRAVFVRDQIAWVWAAPLMATVAAVAGWLLLRSTAPLSMRTAALAGAVVGFLYILLTTVLLELMWDASAALAQRGTLAADKEEHFTEGLALQDRAIALEPENPKLYAARADVYLKRGDVDRAQADIEHALALDPECAEARVLRANLMLEAGDVDSAIAEYDEIIKHQRGFYPAYLNRARAYTLKEDFDRALDDVDRAAELADDVAMASATRAGILYRMGSYDAAIFTCDHTTTLQTVTPIAYAMALVTRGKCHAAKGEHALAANDFENALSRTSDPALITEAEAGLLALGSETPEEPAPETTDLPADVEDTYPDTSKSKLLLLALLGHVLIFFVPTLLLLLVGLLVWSIVSGFGLNSTVIEVETVLLILTAIVFRSLWVRPAEPTDLRLLKEQAPALFDTVEEIRRAVGGPTVHGILLAHGFNASLLSIPRLGLFGWPRKYLSIGLPFMYALSPAELRATLAHELAMSAALAVALVVGFINCI